MYKEIVRKGAELFVPIFEHSDYKYGYISAQVDPRDRDNFDFMLEQAEEFTFHPALQATAKEFSGAIQGMIDFVKESVS